MTTMYSLADRTIQLLNRKLVRRVAKTKGTLFKFDEINALQAFEDLYDQLNDDAIQAYIDLAGLQYRKYCKRRKKLDRDWLFDYVLAMYNPVTGYAYDQEVERKERRAAEEFISKANVHSKDGSFTSDRSKVSYTISAGSEASLRRSSSLWSNMISQYADIVTDKATLQAYKDNGVKYVKWVTQKDEKVCDDCRPLDGKIFPIDEAPDKQHWHCRCYYVPVNK